MHTCTVHNLRSNLQLLEGRMPMQALGQLASPPLPAETYVKHVSSGQNWNHEVVSIVTRILTVSILIDTI